MAFFRLFSKKVLSLSRNLVILSLLKKGDPAGCEAKVEAKNISFLKLRYFAVTQYDKVQHFFRKELFETFKKNLYVIMKSKNSKKLNFLEKIQDL